ncbi:MAG TPA: hypothetical protein VMP00_04765 [Burkholderiales bacterium]|nr:hypothetical protein [Burkholderiales bacterium]
MDGLIYGARRLGGLLLAVGGVGSLVAGGLHPSPRGVETFHDAMVSMLSNPFWPAAHWTALVADSSWYGRSCYSWTAAG